MHGLGSLLFSTWRFEATNSHDKVFALLELAYGEEEIVVDYRVSLKDLFTNVARQLYTHLNPSIIIMTMARSFHLGSFNGVCPESRGVTGCQA
jgi:hypothetical protein